MAAPLNCIGAMGGAYLGKNSTLWNWIFNTQYGAANRLLIQFNLISEPIIWFDTPMKAMGVIVFADTWRMLPLYVLMMLASLQTIPPFSD